MKYVNEVKISGRLTKDSEPNEGSDKQICNLRLASGGKGTSVFIDVVAFGELAEQAGKLKKGDEVEVVGSLSYFEWKTKPKGRSKGGEYRSKHSLVARELVTE